MKAKHKKILGWVLLISLIESIAWLVPYYIADIHAGMKWWQAGLLVHIAAFGVILIMIFIFTVADLINAKDSSDER